MRRIWPFLMFVCALFVRASLARAQGSDGLTARQVLGRTVETVDRISAMSVEYAVRSSPGSRCESDPDVQFDSDGFAISQFVKFWWDVRGLSRMEVREWQPVENRRFISDEVYDEYTYTVDGEYYRGASRASRRGKIRAQAELENGHVTPLTLLGYNICGVGWSHLSRCLLDVGDVAEQVDQLSGGLLRLSAEFDPPDGSYRLGVKLTIDPRQEYLPVGIEAEYLWSKTRAMEIQVSRTAIVSGVRVPVAGRVASYYINEINPDGLTNGDVNAMSKEEYFARVKPRLRHEAVLTGPPLDVSFDTLHMTINDVMPEPFFQLEIPSDYDVADYTESRAIVPNAGVNQLLKPVSEDGDLTPVSSQRLRQTSATDGLEFPDGRELDLGEGLENAYITCKYRIRNVSDREISFRSGVSTTCGCTAGELSKVRLGPGETSELQISLNLPSVAGERKQYAATVHRELADGKLGEIQFVAAVVTSAAWFTVPSEVSVRLAAAESRIAKLNVFGSRDVSATIIGGQTTVPGGRLTFDTARLDPFRPVAVALEIPGDVAEGRYNLTLESDDERFPRRSLTVRVIREAIFEALPASILLRSSEQGESYVGRATLLFPGSVSDLRITGPPGLNSEAGPWTDCAAGRKMTVLTLTCQGLAANDAKTGIVVRAVDADAGMRELHIPVRIAE